MPVTRLVLGLVLLGSVPSYAQGPPGLVPSGGSCCFPGQTFDPSTGTCAAERAPQPQGAEDQGGI
ncbi:MAG: hypothetical protein IT378_03455, partial [Sandaracinaceae bacterium]|nr:hypothetical protein [Sandaracinaceae bacterium]